MNGDNRIILDAVKQNNKEIINLNEKISSIKVDNMQTKTRENEHHSENIKKFDIIFEKLDKVRGINDLKEEVSRLQWIIFVVIILGLFMKIAG